MNIALSFQARILDGPGERTPFPATVPGNVQKDYAAAFGFKDPFFADNYRQFEAIEDSTFEYFAPVDVMPEPGEEIWFVSGGIDYSYSVCLDDRVLYRYEGMYRPVELNLTPYLNGHNLLRIVILPHPKRPDAPQGREQADHSAKPPVCYGWDWNPRLLISGLWEECRLERRTAGTITRVCPSYTLNGDRTEARVRFDVECRSEVTLTLADREGNVVYEGKEKEFVLKNPHLWWCNGQGEAYLYTYTVRSGEDSRCGQIGFRTVRLLRNRPESPLFPKGRYDAPITIELNGRPIPAKGSNFVNPELFWGDDSESVYEPLVRLAYEAHMNVFRMWGGAGLRKDSFYSLCDRYGIMIWQEFMLACNNYPGTPEYLAVLEKEAHACLDRLLPHPCLTLLCGGNELFNSWSGMDDQSLPLRLLDKICFERAPQIPFNKTSPMTGMAHGCYLFYEPDYMGGDVWEMFQKASNTAYTEFGVPSMADADILRSIIPEEELFPPKPTRSYLAHHGFEAWGPTRWICPEIIERYFGKPDNLEQMVDESQLLQAEGYKGAFEEMRRQWPVCSFMTNWDYNEPWPCAANNSLLSYPARPKPAYTAVRDALRPSLFSAKIPRFGWEAGQTLTFEIWLLNDSPLPACGKVTAYLLSDGVRTELAVWEARTEPCRNEKGPEVSFVVPKGREKTFSLELQADNGMQSCYRLCRFRP